MERIRVLHLLHKLGVGGMENGVVNLVNHMDPVRFQNSICSFLEPDTLKERIDANRGEVFVIEKRKGNDLHLVLRLCRMMKEMHPNIVHTHGWGTLGEGMLGAKLAGVPVLVHGEHGTLEMGRINRWVQRGLWSLVDQVVSVSMNLGQRMSEQIGFPRDRIRILVNGVDLKQFKKRPIEGALRDSLGLDPNHLVIGTVGRLIPVKDHKTFLKAFSVLFRKYPGIRGLIIGDGFLRGDLERFAQELGIQREILFAGNRDDVPDLLNIMDIFVLCSLSEGMSNTILEAMACGLPVVATTVGGTPEIVRHQETGLLVQPGDSRGLSEAICHLIAEPGERKRMGEAGQQVIEGYFSLQAMVRNYEELYISLLTKKLGAAFAGNC